MLFVDSLVVIGLAVSSLGTIQETDGTKEQSFWLRNSGQKDITIVQGYTSCGCTTITYNRDVVVSPGDSTMVTLRFNPKGKGGEFLETGTVVYTVADNPTRRFTHVSLEGNCITSEETLLRQYPIRLTDNTRLSANRFDLGRINRGAKCERSVSVLHRDENNRRELIPIVFTADDTIGKGLQHIVRTFSVKERNQELQFDITFDLFIQD